MAKSFFEEQLELMHVVKIKNTHRISTSKNRPLKVSLVNPSEKGVIYANVKKLQGKEGVNRKPYRIENELPDKDRCDASKKSRRAPLAE